MPTILDYMSKSRPGPMCVCKTCGKEFRPDHKYRKYCGVPCSAEDRARVLRSERRVKTHKCAVCDKMFRPTRAGRKCCSRSCANKKRYAAAREAKGRTKPPETPLVPPQPAPMCHCGGLLRFGSDPFTGKSVQYCGVCKREEWAPVYRSATVRPVENVEAA